MGRKRERVLVLQVLYAMEIRRDYRLAVAEEVLRKRAPEDEVSRDFIFQVVQGVIAQREEIDRRIEESSEHWRLSRIAAVDGAVLRMAVYELLFSPDIPVQIILNEAVELAKVYGGEESASFANGVLDQVAAKVRGNRGEGETGQHSG